MTSPTGPVYLSLPREVLGEARRATPTPRRPRTARAPARPPRAAARRRSSGWPTGSPPRERPLIITGQLGRDPREAVALARLAERFAAAGGAVQHRGTSRISATHPMFQGSTPGPLLDEADLVIVLESDVPWIPGKEQPAAGARIVQIGEDPLYARAIRCAASPPT